VIDSWSSDEGGDKAREEKIPADDDWSLIIDFGIPVVFRANFEDEITSVEGGRRLDEGELRVECLFVRDGFISAEDLMSFVYW